MWIKPTPIPCSSSHIFVELQANYHFSLQERKEKLSISTIKNFLFTHLSSFSPSEFNNAKNTTCLNSSTNEVVIASEQFKYRIILKCHSVYGKKNVNNCDLFVLATSDEWGQIKSCWCWIEDNLLGNLALFYASLEGENQREIQRVTSEYLLYEFDKLVVNAEVGEGEMGKLRQKMEKGKRKNFILEEFEYLVNCYELSSDKERITNKMRNCSGLDYNSDVGKHLNSNCVNNTPDKSPLTNVIGYASNGDIPVCDNVALLFMYEKVKIITVDSGKVSLIDEEGILGGSESDLYFKKKISHSIDGFFGFVSVEELLFLPLPDLLLLTSLDNSADSKKISSFFNFNIFSNKGIRLKIAGGLIYYFQCSSPSVTVRLHHDIERLCCKAVRGLSQLTIHQQSFMNCGGDEGGQFSLGRREMNLNFTWNYEELLVMIQGEEEKVGGKFCIFDVYEVENLRKASPYSVTLCVKSSLGRDLVKMGDMYLFPSYFCFCSHNQGGNSDFLLTIPLCEILFVSTQQDGETRREKHKEKEGEGGREKEKEKEKKDILKFYTKTTKGKRIYEFVGKGKEFEEFYYNLIDAFEKIKVKKVEKGPANILTDDPVDRGLLFANSNENHPFFSPVSNQLLSAEWLGYFEINGGREHVILKSREFFVHFISKGIPDELRCYYWKLYTGGYYCSFTKNDYQRIQQEMNEFLTMEESVGSLKDGKNQRRFHVLDEIEKDLRRSLPQHPAFKSHTGLDSLRRLLRAFAFTNPSIGYTQGMNIIASIFLLYLAEWEAYVATCVLVHQMLPGQFSRTLVGSVVDQKIFEELLRIHVPQVWKKFKQVGVEVNLLTVPWFVCLFVNILPFADSMKFIDSFLHDGSVFTFQFALAIFNLNQGRISKCRDDDELIGCVKGLFCPLLNPAYSYDEIVQTAIHKFSKAITWDALECYRRTYKISTVQQIESMQRKQFVKNLTDEFSLLSTEEINRIYSTVKKICLFRSNNGLGQPLVFYNNNSNSNNNKTDKKPPSLVSSENSNNDNQIISLSFKEFYKVCSYILPQFCVGSCHSNMFMLKIYSFFKGNSFDLKRMLFVVQVLKKYLVKEKVQFLFDLYCKKSVDEREGDGVYFDWDEFSSNILCLLPDCAEELNKLKKTCLLTEYDDKQINLNFDLFYSNLTKTFPKFIQFFSSKSINNN